MSVTVKDGVKLGCGMFIVLPIIILIISIIAITFFASFHDTVKANSSNLPILSPAQYTSDNFPYKNVVLNDAGYGSNGIDAIGELTNNSGKNFNAASFVMSLYDKDDRLLGSNYIILNNFTNGQTKTFNTIILDTDYKSVAKYKIQFENGY